MSFTCTCWTWTWGSHRSAIKTLGHFVRHLSKGYTSSNNRGGYKFRGATYLIWEPALFLFRYEWQKATDNYWCSGSITPLQWKTIGTQVYKEKPTVFPCRSHSSGGTSSSPNPWKVNYTDAVAPPCVSDVFARCPTSATRILKIYSHCACPRG